MKKYNRIILLSIILYLVLASLSGVMLYSNKKQGSRFYEVEINRIYYALSGAEPKPEISSCKYIKKVLFLKADSPEKDIAMFFSIPNHNAVEIRPWFFNGILTGYLRFEYARSDENKGYLLALSQAPLFCLELCILAILIFLKRKLIKPFHNMKELPYELAKGHFNSDIKEEKENYFGDFMRSVGHLKDTLAVTRRRELELIKEKKLMILSLSHDIKTPLNTIRLYEKSLADSIYSDERQKQHALAQIRKKTEEIEKYVENIIDASREDILDIKVEKGEFYLEDLINKALGTYREKCSLRMLKLTIGDYNNRLLQGDMDRALEVFENIFENAFKYGDGRLIEVTFREEEYCQLIRIYNTGECVSDNDMNHIFESFFRGGNSKRQQGSGLGLYICREIMHKMGGEIYAEKCEGGMAFVLVFE